MTIVERKVLTVTSAFVRRVLMTTGTRLFTTSRRWIAAVSWARWTVMPRRSGKILGRVRLRTRAALRAVRLKRRATDAT
jgi:hypothetical protein